MLYKTKWYFLPCYYHYLTYTTPYTDVEFLQHMDITSTINHFLFSMCHKFMVDLMHSFISFFFSQNFPNIHTDILFVISFFLPSFHFQQGIFRCELFKYPKYQRNTFSKSLSLRLQSFKCHKK